MKQITVVIVAILALAGTSLLALLLGRKYGTSTMRAEALRAIAELMRMRERAAWERAELARNVEEAMKHEEAAREWQHMAEAREEDYRRGECATIAERIARLNDYFGSDITRVDVTDEDLDGGYQIERPEDAESEDGN